MYNVHYYDNHSQSVHIDCRHTISAHLFFRDFPFLSLFSYPPRLSLSLSLSLVLSLSIPLLSLSFSLYASFPPFLSFQERVKNFRPSKKWSPFVPVINKTGELWKWIVVCQIFILHSQESKNVYYGNLVSMKYDWCNFKKNITI